MACAKIKSKFTFRNEEVQREKKNYSNVISSSEFIGWLCVSKCVHTLCIIGVCVRGASAHSIFIKHIVNGELIVDYDFQYHVFMRLLLLFSLFRVCDLFFLFRRALDVEKRQEK